MCFPDDVHSRTPCYTGFGPVPPGLVAASNAAQEGKAPGKLTISLALILPPSDSEAVTVSGGSVLADGVALGPRVRRLLSRVQTEALRVRGMRVKPY